jgi:predicted MFS family arabinose efflux permease
LTRDFRLAAAALFCWGCGESMFAYFIPLYMSQLGADAAQIGIILGLVSLFMTLSFIPGGMLSDRVGSRHILRLGWVVGMLAVLVLYLAPNVLIFSLGLFLYYASAFVVAPINSYITNARGRWSVTRALTTSSAAFNVGSIFGALAGGYLGERIGLRSTFAFSALIFIASTALVFLLGKQPVQPRAGQPRSLALLRNPAFNRLVGLAFFSTIAMYLFWPLVPNYLQDVRDVSVGAIGVLGSINSLGVALLSLALGRMRPQWALPLCQVFMAASAAFLWTGTGLPWFALGYFLASGYRISRTIAIAMSQRLVKPSRLGFAYGMMDTVIGVGTMIAPALDGLLYSLRPTLPFTTSLVLMGISLLGTILILPSLSTYAAPRENMAIELRIEEEEP